MLPFTAKMIKIPLPPRSPDEPAKMIKLGIRIQLDAGEWWFYRFKKKAKCSDGKIREKKDAIKWLNAGHNRRFDMIDASTWSRHLPGHPITGRLGNQLYNDDGSPKYTKEKTDGPYEGDEALIRTYGHATKPYPLVYLLITARDQNL